MERGASRIVEKGKSTTIVTAQSPLTEGSTQIVDAVHAKGSYIYLQLWALGRAANPAELREENPDYPYVSASDVPLPEKSDGEAPRPLTIPGEIR